jgi:hypothetical protein
MDPLYAPPSEVEVLDWFSGYSAAFSQDQNEEQMVKEVSNLYRHVFECFKRSRETAGRTSSQVHEDLRVFGFDYYDLKAETPIRFYSKLRVPAQYRPPPTSGQEFGEDTQVIWPKHERRRWLASYLRNSSAHGTTHVSNGVVSIENRRNGELVPNFRIFLPVREYVRLIAISLQSLVTHVVQRSPTMNQLGRLALYPYGELVGFFRRFLEDLP